MHETTTGSETERRNAGVSLPAPMQRIFDLTRRGERIVDPELAPDWER